MPGVELPEDKREFMPTPNPTPMVMPLPAQGPSPVTTNPDLSQATKERQDIFAANETIKKAEGSLQQAEPLLRLSTHVKNAFEAANRAKKQDIEPRLLACLRQKQSVYSPEKMAQIKKTGGSEVFMNLTNVKCTSVAHWVKDVEIPPGDKPWTLGETPVPELPPAVEKEIMELAQLEAARELIQNEMVMQGVSASQMVDKVQDILEKAQEVKKKRARRAAKRFELKIEDELQEGNFYGALSEFIDDLTTFPSAFLKGPVIKRKQVLTWSEDEKGKAVPKVKYKYVRMYSRVSPFDAFPAPGAKTIQDGYFIERIRYRRTDLDAMRGVPGFKNISAAILKYGKGGLSDWTQSEQERAQIERRPSEQDDPDPPIYALEYWGFVQGQLLREWGMTEQQVPVMDRDYQVHCILIGEFIIMARLNPHPLGTRPYFSTSFDKATNDSVWGGNSLPEKIKDVQDICNSAARSLVNNMAIASGPMFEMIIERLAAGEDPDDVHPFKIFKTMEDSSGHGRHAIQQFKVESMVPDLLKVFEYFFQQASEQSGIPAYTYGSDNVRGAGETASGLSMLMNAASKTLKGIVKNIDTDIVKKAIKEHWTHLMLFDEDIFKCGDIQVVARASEHLLVQEQLQLRRNEWLTATNNPIDMKIIGERGRAVVLRENAKLLKLPDSVVPTDKEMEEREAMEDQMRQLLSRLEAQRGQMAGGGVSLPGGDAQSLTPAGGIPGEQFREAA